MQVSNLQIEGLLMAVVAMNELLVRKGLLTVDEIEDALHKAEIGIVGEERAIDDLSPPLRDATCFPIRLLRLANRDITRASDQSFSALARQIGLTKRLYNDQV